MGAGEGLNGFTIVATVTWTALRRRIQEPIIVQECVEEFEQWVLLEELPMYYVDYCILSPSDLGWPISRRRKWCV